MNTLRKELQILYDELLEARSQADYLNVLRRIALYQQRGPLEKKCLNKLAENLTEFLLEQSKRGQVFPEQLNAANGIAQLLPESLILATLTEAMAMQMVIAGETEKATDLLVFARELAEHFAPGSITLANIAGNLGNILLESGAFDQGLQQLNQAATILEQHSPKSLTFANVLSCIGQALLEKGDLEEALRALCKSREILVLREPESQEIAYISAAIASIWTQKGDFEKALGLLEPAAKITQKLFPNSTQLAHILHCLGELWLKQQKFTEALSAQEQARDILERYQPGSLLLAQSYSSIGNVWLATGDLDKALKPLMKARDIFELVDNGSETQAMNLSSIGVILRQKGYLDLALGHHNKAKDIRERLAPDSVNTAKTYVNIGNIWLEKGIYNEALRFLSKARSNFETQSPDSEELGIAYLNIGNVFLAKNELDCALEFYTMARQLCERHAPCSLSLASTYGNIGIIWLRKQDVDQALSFQDMARSIDEQFPQNQLGLANTFANIGNIWFQKGKLDRALSFYDQAREIQEKLAPESLALAKSYGNIGNIWQELGDLDEALKFQSKAQAIHETAAPASRDRVTSESNLVNLQKMRRAVGTSHDLMPQFERAWSAIALVASGISDIVEARLFLDEHAWIPRQYGDELASQDDQINAFLVRQQAENLYLRLTLARRIRDDQADALRQTIDQSQAIVDATLKRLENPNLEDDLRTRIREDQEQAIEKRDTAQKDLDELLDRVLGFQDVPLDQAHEVLGESGVYLSYYVQPKSTILYVVWRGELKIFNLPVGEDEPVDGDTHQWWHEVLPDPSDGLETIRFVRPGRALDIAHLFFPPEVQKILWEAVDEARAKGEVPLVAISRDGVIGRTAMNHLPISREGENAPLASVADVTYINSLGHLKLTKEYTTTGSGAVIVGVADHGSPDVGGSGAMRGAEAHHNLPLVKEETEMVAAVYGVPPLLDGDAEKSRVVERARTASVIALASHGGYAPDDPLSAHVVLFPPDHAKGWLAGYDLAQDKFQASLMTASCCVTGQAGAYAGRELASFGYAAQLAGIRCVVVSQWPVAEKTAKEFMITFHGFFAQGLTVGESYRCTMTKLGANENWATFVIIGDPRVSLPASS